MSDSKNTTLTKYALMTERFCLHKICPDDYEFLCEMYSDAEVMKYISTGVCDGNKTRELHNQLLQDWIDNSFGAWMIQAKSNNEKLGYMGFRRLPEKEGIEFFGLLIKKAWDQGAATEIGKTCLDHGFHQLGFDGVYSVVDPGNSASHKWLTKLGMKRLPDKDGIFHNSFTHYYSLKSNQLQS